MKPMRVDLDGGPVHYVDFGGSGRPMVMVHGLGGSYLEWKLLAPLLIGRYRVLAPDLIGFGRTPLRGRHSTVDANVSILSGFVDAMAGGSAVVVGHSMGGLLSMLLAGRHPASVTELVLIDPATPPTGHEASGLLPRPVIEWLTSHPRAGNAVAMLIGRAFGASTLVEDSIKRAVADFDAFDPALLQDLIEQEEERMGAGLPYVGWLEARRSLAQMYGDVAAFDAEVVDAIVAPTLLIFGDRDRVVRGASIERVAARRPDWTFEVLENVGHDPNMEVPALVARLVRRHLEAAAA